MPKGPHGEKRPADAIGLAVMIGKIATGEIDDEREKAPNPNVKSEAGKKGGAARSASLSAKRRKEISTQAAKSRWATPAPAATTKQREPN
jgi:hypothetical protein